MSNLATDYDIVIGVDTHEEFHVAAVVDTVTGGKLDEYVFDATVEGYEEVLGLLDEHHPGVRAWSVEGTASHGIGLSRYLAAAGERVFEADRPDRSKRRNGAKTDSIDAVRAAREALGRDDLAIPREQDGIRAQLQALSTTRRFTMKQATDTERHFRSLVVTAPDNIRDRFRGLTLPQMVKRAAVMRGPRRATALEHTISVELTRLARNALQLRHQVRVIDAQLRQLVQSWRPDLLDLFGVGPVCSATILSVWSHPGRVHSEAAFAMLAGTAPIPATSGKQSVPGRHRLNRSGDRHLNQAIHTIVLARQRHDQTTKAYVARRLAEGKTPREIQRCLKRYVTRQLYKQLELTA